jgi:hypothetical protein
LERRVARVEFAEGAFARLRVPVKVEAEPGRDVLTDIDVLSIDIDLRLRVSRSALECKSTPGQSGEPDRLFWLRGFQEYLGVERAVLVRQTTTQRGALLARRLGLHLLDEDTLRRREASNAWLPDKFGHISGEACRAAETRTDTQLRAIAQIPPTLVSFLRHEVFLEESYRILGALVALAGAAQQVSVYPIPPEWFLLGMRSWVF